jgi:hypothetical protein
VGGEEAVWGVAAAPLLILYAVSQMKNQQRCWKRRREAQSSAVEPERPEVGLAAVEGRRLEREEAVVVVR